MSAEKIFKITLEERIAIKMDYGRTEKEIEKDMQHLKYWLEKQPHLPQDEDDKMLRAMLIYNKFSLEKTKKKFDMFYSIRNFVPEFYENREPLNPKVSRQLDYSMVMPLPNLTPELYRVIIFKIMCDDVSKFDLDSYIKNIFTIFDMKLANDSALGDQYIIDCENVKFGHIIQFTLTNVKKYYTVIQKAYSDRVKGIHFINLPPAGVTLVQITNAVLSKKLEGRVSVYSDLNKLCDVLTKNTLPVEYGGSAGHLMDIYAEWKKFLKSQNDWLKNLAEKKSDESRRIGEPVHLDELFGVTGSFRQLNVD